jgi:hypothetical protein
MIGKLLYLVIGGTIGMLAQGPLRGAVKGVVASGVKAQAAIDEIRAEVRAEALEDRQDAAAAQESAASGKPVEVRTVNVTPAG